MHYPLGVCYSASGHTPLEYKKEKPDVTETTTRTYTVRGMTCEHCAASVNEEVSEVAGVAQVSVDLASGRLEVTGEQVSDDEVRAAVEEAGYALAARR
jgi:copper chaperone